MDKCSLVKVSKTSVNDRVEWTDSINTISYYHHLKYRAGWVNHHNAACKISSLTEHTLDSLKQEHWNQSYFQSQVFLVRFFSPLLSWIFCSWISSSKIPSSGFVKISQLWQSLCFLIHLESKGWYAKIRAEISLHHPTRTAYHTWHAVTPPKTQTASVIWMLNCTVKIIIIKKIYLLFVTYHLQLPSASRCVLNNLVVQFFLCLSGKNIKLLKPASHSIFAISMGTSLTEGPFSCSFCFHLLKFLLLLLLLLFKCQICLKKRTTVC